MALGARRADVIAMVVRQGLMLASAGLIAGALLSLAMARSIASLSFTDSGMGGGAKLIGGSTAIDPVIYLCAAAFLFAVAAAAAYVPARRAARIDPMQALRAE
jgi:putative ABC transport system permease protein